MVVMDAARPVSKFGCVLGYPGPLPCRGCPPSCPEHPEDARPAGERAADLDAIQRVFEMYGVNLTPVNMLVARVADLEARRDAWVAEAVQNKDRARAAEAQVAALTQRVDDLERFRRLEAEAKWSEHDRAEAAEAALATVLHCAYCATAFIPDTTPYPHDSCPGCRRGDAALANTRQALAEILSDETGVYANVRQIARRALAAGDNTTEPA